MSQARGYEHILKDSWPYFLDMLADRPSEAREEFAQFALWILRHRPPSILLSQTQERREDYIQEIVIHLLDNDEEVLRQYRNKGKPFSSWFIVVAMRKAYTLYRRDASLRQRESSLNEQDPDHFPQSETATPEERRRMRVFLYTLNSYLNRLSHKCQVLIRAAADGLRPREMVALLPNELRDNKHASDTLSGCQKRLQKMLNADGIKLADYLELKRKKKKKKNRSEEDSDDETTQQ